ncbi:MAG TPA: MFS transporter [Bryobacteraceae bacterium]|nr:MFS transporter [Bryobacteraceae bacterium]
MLRSLRHRNFRLFFTGQLISLVGTWMQTVAESWLVYRLTGSAAMLGVIGFSSQIPVFLFAPIGGAVADRYNRQYVVIGTQTAAMLLAGVLASLTLTGVVQVWHVAVLAASLGVVNAFDIPARQSFIVEMVGREDLPNAIALNSSMFNGARIVGPAVAGVLVAAIGEGWCFAANAISYIAVITGLFMMNVPRSAQKPVGSAVQRIREGFSWVARNAPIRDILLLLGSVSLLGMPFSVLMPIFADRILHGGASGLGILMGASGVGACAGALTLAARRGVRGLGSWVMIACGGFGVSLACFSLSRVFWLSAVLLVPVGYSMMVQMASSNTLIQTYSPDYIRGRVMAVYSMMFMGMAPLGSLLAGSLAHQLGAPEVVLGSGIGCVIAAAVFGRRLPKLRIAAREMILAQQMVAGNPAEEVTATGTEEE